MVGHRIPCIKCLVYASCRNRIQVDCHDLYEYIQGKQPTVRSVKRWLPVMERIFDSDPPKHATPFKGMAFRSKNNKGVYKWGILSNY